MTKTTAAPQQDPLIPVKRRLSTILEDTLQAAEAWSPEDDGLKEARRARAISAMARAALDIARLSPQPLPTDFLEAPIDVTPSEPPSPPPPDEAPAPEISKEPTAPESTSTGPTPPRPAPALILRARPRTVKAKALQPESEMLMNDRRPLDPAELEALRDEAFARLDRFARRLEQKSEAERPGRGDPEPPPVQLDAERPSGAASAGGG